jgi:hypothetical protein
MSDRAVVDDQEQECPSEKPIWIDTAVMPTNTLLAAKVL